MTVKELINLLKTFPQDAIVIQTMHSDFQDVEKETFTLITPDHRLIRHHGHLMYVQRKWLEENQTFEYLTAVHIEGN